MCPRLWAVWGNRLRPGVFEEADNAGRSDPDDRRVPRVLADGQTLRVRDVCELVTDHMGLTAEVRAEMIASGQLRYVNRINWADSALTHAGVLDRPARGNYRITDDGRTVDARSLTSYSEQDMLE